MANDLKDSDCTSPVIRPGDQAASGWCDQVFAVWTESDVWLMKDSKPVRLVDTAKGIQRFSDALNLDPHFHVLASGMALTQQLQATAFRAMESCAGARKYLQLSSACHHRMTQKTSNSQEIKYRLSQLDRPTWRYRKAPCLSESHFRYRSYQ